MATNTTPAGGRATQAGMDFGAAVGVWFASHLVMAAPVGRRFGLGVCAFPVRLQFETGTGLDDIEVGLSDGSVILIPRRHRQLNVEALASADGVPGRGRLCSTRSSGKNSTCCSRH